MFECGIIRRKSNGVKGLDDHRTTEATTLSRESEARGRLSLVPLGMVRVGREQDPRAAALSHRSSPHQPAATIHAAGLRNARATITMERNSPCTAELRRTESGRFDCTRLGSPATITAQRTICRHADPNDTHQVAIRLVECANKFDCGLYAQDGFGGYSATEDAAAGCSAQVTMREKGDIHLR